MAMGGGLLKMVILNEKKHTSYTRKHNLYRWNISSNLNSYNLLNLNGY
jgi:hypothetical protein